VDAAAVVTEPSAPTLFPSLAVVLAYDSDTVPAPWKICWSFRYVTADASDERIVIVFPLSGERAAPESNLSDWFAGNVTLFEQRQTNPGGK
jgi:hypothetical protein